MHINANNASKRTNHEGIKSLVLNVEPMLFTNSQQNQLPIHAKDICKKTFMPTSQPSNKGQALKDLKGKRHWNVDIEKYMDEVIAGKKDSSITCVEKENNMCKVKLIAKG